MKSKNCLLLIIFFVLSIIGLAQITPRPRSVSIPVARPTSWDSYINITDFNGRLFKNKYPDIEGSPFFLDSFHFSTVTTSKGAVYENVQTRIDLYSNEIQLIAKEGREIIAQDGLIKNVLLTDSSKAEVVSYFFRSGYPAIDKNNGNSFYEVLSDGTIQLLKHEKREIQEAKNEMSGEVRKEFIRRENYYVFVNGEIKRIKKEKETILELMQNQKSKIDIWIKNNKTNFKSIEALTKLFEYYNSLNKAF